MKDKQLAEALTAYFEGRESEAEEALESMSRTSENPAVFQALFLMNALKNYPKAVMFSGKRNSLYNKDKEAFNQAFAEVKPLLEFYAEKQVPSAQTFLGFMYYNGWGVKEDKAKGVKWYRKAAEQGYAEAQFLLGLMYHNGEGVKEDDSEAVKWWSKAAEQGLASAQFLLGLMYYTGAGVKEDKTEAVKWWSKAADQGFTGAQFGMGIAYCYGSGVEKDYTTAYMWYFLASLNGLSFVVNDKLLDMEKEGSAKVSPSEASEAKAEAIRKYNEIRKRYGLD